MDISVIIACGGSSSRFGSDKLFANLNGHTVIEETVSKFLFLSCPIILSVPKEKYGEYKKLFPSLLMVEGGFNRTQSVYNALKVVKTKYVLIHDGSRPFISEKNIKDIIDALIEKGNAVPTIQVTETICDVKNSSYVDRDNYLLIQTPQGYLTDEIKSCYSVNVNAYDDSSLYFKKYGRINFVAGNRSNIKITYKEDLYRNGIGIDLHKLEEGNGIKLGGIFIPCDYKVVAHSDGDVVIHSIMNALLSSIGKRDIGYYFPDSDPEYKNIDSRILLKKVLDMLDEENYNPSSLSITIELEKPKLSSYIDDMKKSLSKEIGIDEGLIGICVTSGEGLGDIGNNKAIRVTTILNIFPK